MPLRRDPFLGSLPPMQPPSQGPQEVMQDPQPDDASNLIWQMIQKNLGAQPPAPRRLSNWEIFAGLANPDLMNVVLGRRYDTPEMMQYQAGQKALPSMVQAYGASQRGQQFGQREARLDEQFRWRQLLQSQYKRTPTNLYNPETGLNEQWIIFSDPTNNNIEVGRVPSSFSQMHYGAVAGPGGEMYQYPTSPQPGRSAVPGGGQPQTGGMPPIHQTTGTPTTGANVTGSVPSGTPSGGPPTPGNVRRLGVARPPSAGVGQEAAGKSAFAAGLDNLLAYQTKAYRAQTEQFGQAELSPLGIPAWSGQAITDIASRNRFTQPLVTGGLQAVKDYNVNMLPMLFAFVKQQTGVQFGMKEFNMYGGQFPTSMDDVDTALEKMGGLVRSVRLGRIAMEEQFHGIEPDPKFTTFAGKKMPRQVLRSLPPAERLRFIVGGGEVID